MTTTTNLVPLDVGLKEKFQKLFRSLKQNTIALAQEAFQIHSQHYLVTERKYDKDFEVWWKIREWIAFLVAEPTGRNGTGLAKQ